MTPLVRLPKLVGVTSLGVPTGPPVSQLPGDGCCGGVCCCCCWPLWELLRKTKPATAPLPLLPPPPSGLEVLPAASAAPGLSQCEKDAWPGEPLVMEPGVSRRLEAPSDEAAAALAAPAACGGAVPTDCGVKAPGVGRSDAEKRTATPADVLYGGRSPKGLLYGE